MAMKTLSLNEQFGGPQCWPVFCDMDSAVAYSLEVHIGHCYPVFCDMGSAVSSRNASVQKD